MQFQRNDKKRSAQPASGGRPAKDLQPTKSIRSSTARDSFSQTPHVRGKDDEGRLKLRHVGITPACAGKRPAPPAQLPLLKDHPRVCGEKDERIAQSDELAGSPPRMRGKGNLKIALVLGVGITPAHAGKSGRYARGIPAGLGSPPHMRGKAGDDRAETPRAGITPACAGKSHVVDSIRPAFWDHPRMCGEKSDFAATAHPVLGSPPHVRGKAHTKT